jgi:hypothetical protein
MTVHAKDKGDPKSEPHGLFVLHPPPELPSKPTVLKVEYAPVKNIIFSE